MVHPILTHPLFWTIILAGAGAQVAKFVIYSIRFKTIHPLDLLATGGMPSSHSALMVGVSMTIYILEGATTSFFLALALTSVIIVDAMGVRRTAGEEGLLMHQLITKTRLKLKEPHYSLGHTPTQVLAGAVFGFLVSLLVNYWMF